ncbi:MAG: glutamate synthase large subunit [Deltaproteobacteria bacterium HGW-Deltaproteobacteria-14]|jgi:glutamate synthase (NADPH/NADH) large chain|nr:MAG: glutamate synthase large subunit [Deltaproteobacteria bacterium HGW-Deltaproteobacteria-14]
MVGLPTRWGLYDPRTEHDACGVGFVANILGVKSRGIVEQALDVLQRLAHRGASGSDPETGDGAGILLQIPHRFFKREGLRHGWDMPRRRRYGIGMVFLPQDPRNRRACEEAFEEVVSEQGQYVIGWRDVPVDVSAVGTVAKQTLPVIRQIYIGCRRVIPSALERKLYVIRKLTENRVRERGVDPEGRFHVASLSAETIVYKGLLLPKQVPRFFRDLTDPDMVSGLAVVHSRFSTNTFPTWDRAQPCRYVAHNGEINTLQGNINQMRARRAILQSAKFDGPLDRLYPIIVERGSDSAQFDNMLELLHLGGRSLDHAMMMLIPEAWESDKLMDPERAAFYEYSSNLMEPWDGPAAIVFTDGHLIGATLDRNGLRPARWLVTNDDRVILSSEVGVVDIEPMDVRAKGRLQPGRMFLVDTTEGRIISDDEAKREVSTRWPYRRWLDSNLYNLDDVPGSTPLPPVVGEELVRLQRAFGYTDEDVRLVLEPMGEDGQEPTGSMGNDTPLAVLSDQAPTLFNYFQQLFAQVTNPPIDPIREALVMNIATTLGPEGNTFEETPEQCHRVRLSSPILTNVDLAKVRALKVGVFEPTTLQMVYDASVGLAVAVDQLCHAAVRAIDEGYNILILSDRSVDSRRRPIPALLAVSAVHAHLVREGIRFLAGLVVETAEARAVHHFATLFGYGAACVNPYLALDSVRAAALDGDLTCSADEAEKHFVKAVEKGLLKVMSKMGISTLQSYRGAQIFEAVGLNRDLVDRHFTGTASRIEGIGLAELGREVEERHQRGFAVMTANELSELPAGGYHQWRRRGELHLWNPATIAKLQAATRSEDATTWDEYSQLVNEEASRSTLRGLLEFKWAPDGGVPLAEVEPATEIVKRFATGAMSFGSISAEAHETLAVAMNRIGGKSNSGEGGEEPRRYVRDEAGDLRRSAIHQVASGRFGVNAEYLVNATELQIKMAQGAKPGEGGQLPGHKVDERIAKVRCATPGVTLISPPPHHDIYSIEDLAQLIYDLKAVNQEARVSVKLVSEVGVGTVAAGVAKAGAGAVVIAGDAGGTGASPMSSLKHAGLPWELGLSETQAVLVQNDLRGRLRVQVDGGLRTGRDVAIGALLGAEEFGFSTAPLIALGCIMLRKCHLNTCSVGIATQDPELRKLFAGKPEHAVRFFFNIAEDVRAIMARLGVRRFDDLVGRKDLLEVAPSREHWKAKKVDVRPIIERAKAPDSVARYCVMPQSNPFAEHLDRTLIAQVKETLEGGPRTELVMKIRNTDRTVGGMLSGEVARRHGARGLVDDAITVHFRGQAGQSFGAWLAKGVTFKLEGDANDYVGKGLSGGRLAIRHPINSRYEESENIVIGNTALYGATGGEAYIAGRAGERFAVRNSGAKAVVEGVGDHGCEYMTGGVVVVLGPTGRNFAAGMSGGTAFVFDKDRSFADFCNRAMVDLESMVDESDLWLVYAMLEDHVRYTDSRQGRRILDNWEMMVTRFVKVMPVEYRRVLQQKRAATRPTETGRYRVLGRG